MKVSWGHGLTRRSCIQRPRRIVFGMPTISYFKLDKKPILTQANFENQKLSNDQAQSPDHKRLSSGKSHRKETSQERLTTELVQQIIHPFRCLRVTNFALDERVIFIHEPGAQFPTTEIDVLVVSTFGVICVSAIDHRGYVLPGDNEHTLKLVNERGELVWCTSPLWQQRPARDRLRVLLEAQRCPVYSIGIFTDGSCALHSSLPDSILLSHELLHFLRLRYGRFVSSRQPWIDVHSVHDLVSANTDKRVDAVRRHRMNLADSHWR